MLSTNDLNKWITVNWEPSHNINLADHEILEMQIFSLLTRITNIIASISSSLNIGKGLEQMFNSVEDLHTPLYKYRHFEIPGLHSTLNWHF